MKALIGVLVILTAVFTVHAANYTVRAGQSLVIEPNQTLLADYLYLGFPGSASAPSDGACGASLTVSDGATLLLSTQFMSAGENVSLTVSNGAIRVRGQYAFYFGYSAGEHISHSVSNNTATFIGEFACIRSDSSQSQIKFTSDSQVIFDLSAGAYQDPPLVGKYIEINADATVKIIGIEELARTLKDDVEVPLARSDEGYCYLTPASRDALKASLPDGCRLIQTAGINASYCTELKLFIPARAPESILIDGTVYTFERAFGKDGNVFICSDELPGAYSRDEALDFLADLNHRNHTRLRLPTKAEWESACIDEEGAKRFFNLFDGKREWCSDEIGKSCGILKGGGDDDWPEYRNAGFDFLYHPACRDELHGIRPVFSPAGTPKPMGLSPTPTTATAVSPTTRITTAWINQPCDIATIEFSAGQRTPYFINQGGSTRFTLSRDAALGDADMLYIYSQSTPVGAVHTAEVVFDFAADGNHTLRIPCARYFQTCSDVYSTLGDPFAHEYRFLYIGGVWDLCGGALSFGYNYSGYPAMHTIIDGAVFTNMNSCTLVQRNRRGLLELKNGAAIYSDGNVNAFETTGPDETGSVIQATGRSLIRADGYFYIGFPGGRNAASRPCGANRLELFDSTVKAGVQVMMTGSDFTTVLSNSLISVDGRHSFYYGYRQGEFITHEVARNEFIFAGLHPRIRSAVPELAQIQFQNTRITFDLKDGPYLEAPVVGAKSEMLDSCEIKFVGLEMLRRKIDAPCEIDLAVSLTGELVFSDALAARTAAALPDGCRLVKEKRNRVYLTVEPLDEAEETAVSKAAYYGIRLDDGSVERFDAEPAGGWSAEFRHGDRMLFKDLGAYAIGVYEVCGADGRPITGISYEEAEEFAAALTMRLGLPFSLPTEEQWLNANPETEGEMDFYHYYNGGSNGTATVAGSFAPNPLGLYDMKGNAAEWCRGLALKGGSFVHHAAGCRNDAVRYIVKTDYRDITTGMRLVLNLDGSDAVRPPNPAVFPRPTDARQFRSFDFAAGSGEYLDPESETERWDGSIAAVRPLFRRIGGENDPGRFYLAVFETVRDTGYSRNDAEDFIAVLNARSTYGRFSLPSEAEWTLAADEELRNQNQTPLFVNLFGGAREWCSDRIGADCGVLRGGSDEDWPEYRSGDCRFFAHPAMIDSANGFRMKWTPPYSEPHRTPPLSILFN